MNTKTFRAHSLLLLTAIIWGFAFSAQRLGAQYLGTFYFNGIRFTLGSLSLLPLILLQIRRRRQKDYTAAAKQTPVKLILLASICCGVCLFSGAALQQMGMESTTAGKGGFITGLYIVFVPITGLFLKKRPPLATWIGVCIAVTGLYLLSVKDSFTISNGDFLVFIGAFFWTGHILFVDYFSKKMNTLVLSSIQFAICGILSLICGFFTEEISFYAVRGAIIPILYGGFFSVGVAYTLQVIAQKDTEPAAASLLLSLEAVFSAVGGFLVLGETLSVRELTGCVLIFAAILLAQVPPRKNLKHTHSAKTEVLQDNEICLK